VVQHNSRPGSILTPVKNFSPDMNKAPVYEFLAVVCFSLFLFFTLPENAVDHMVNAFTQTTIVPYPFCLAFKPQVLPKIALLNSIFLKYDYTYENQTWSNMGFSYSWNQTDFYNFIVVDHDSPTVPLIRHEICGPHSLAIYAIAKDLDYHLSLWVEFSAICGEGSYNSGSFLPRTVKDEKIKDIFKRELVAHEERTGTNCLSAVAVLPRWPYGYRILHI